MENSYGNNSNSLIRSSTNLINNSNQEIECKNRYLKINNTNNFNYKNQIYNDIKDKLIYYGKNMKPVILKKENPKSDKLFDDFKIKFINNNNNSIEDQENSFKNKNSFNFKRNEFNSELIKNYNNRIKSFALDVMEKPIKIDNYNNDINPNVFDRSKNYAKLSPKNMYFSNFKNGERERVVSYHFIYKYNIKIF